MGEKAMDYRAAGVDIDAGNAAVELMKPHVKTTLRPEVIGGLGGFGGLFALDMRKYREPVLVSGTDGVGTKLKVAFLCNRHETIGIDAVAMCVNDILVQGAEPLFFLDYLAVGKLIPEKVAAIVKGVAEGCRQAGCALIGGETAEMPGMYGSDEYDIAGFAVGVVEKSKLIDGSTIVPGDRVIGLPSTGLHSNGYSLARKVLLEMGDRSVETHVPELGKTLGEELLIPTKIYVRPLLKLMKRHVIKGMAHITGGGLVENIPRVLPEGTQVVLERKTWEVPPVFGLIQREGKVAEAEMFRTFNMGIGMVLIVAAHDVEAVLQELRNEGENPCLIGEVQAGSRRVVIV